MSDKTTPAPRPRFRIAGKSTHTEGKESTTKFKAYEWNAKAGIYAYAGKFKAPGKSLADDACAKFAGAELDKRRADGEPEAVEA